MEVVPAAVVGDLGAAGPLAEVGLAEVPVGQRQAVVEPKEVLEDEQLVVVQAEVGLLVELAGLLVLLE